MDQALLAIQVACAGILLVAATGKVVRSDDFAAAIRLSRLPADKLLQIAIPTVEVGLALALLIATPESLRIAMAATTVLFAAFTLWAASVIMRGIKLKCGCFGGSSREVGSRTVARNSVLIVLAAAGWILSLRAESPIPDPSLWSSITTSSAAMMAAILVAVRFGWSALALRVDDMNPQKPVLQIEPKE